MLALAEILGLVILNALIHTAFTRWKLARRTSPAKRYSKVRISTHYPLHPSPVASALSFEGATEHAAPGRPAGIDW
jgi:hypothetical protein